MGKVSRTVTGAEEIKSKKKRVNSRNKGSGWERAVLKLLTCRFGLPFDKTPDSGARGTTGTLDTSAQVALTGDIVCPEGFKFVIECKKGYDIDLCSLFGDSLTSGRKSDLDDMLGFMSQVTGDSLRVGKHPMIIYRKDNRPPLVGFDVQKGGAELDAHIANNFEGCAVLSWRGWLFVPLEVALAMPNSFYFDEENLPRVVEGDWRRALGKTVKEFVSPRLAWERALSAVVIHGLTLRDLMKMPVDHEYRGILMPAPFDQIPVNEYISLHAPKEAMASPVADTLKRLSYRLK